MAASNKSIRERALREVQNSQSVYKELFEGVLEDKELFGEIFKKWALDDPKGFMTLLEKGQPKVQPIDQNELSRFQSLQDMMIDLPGREDIILKLKKAEARAADLTIINIQHVKRIKDLEDTYLSVNSDSN